MKGGKKAEMIYTKPHIGNLTAGVRDCAGKCQTNLLGDLHAVVQIRN